MLVHYEFLYEFHVTHIKCLVQDLVVYTSFIIFCKSDLIKSLLFWCFSLCSDKNSYLFDAVDKCIKEFLRKILTPKPAVSAAPKKDLVIALPCLGKLSPQICTRINRIMKNKLPCCKIQFVFQTKYKISNFFTKRQNSIVVTFWYCLQSSVWWLQCYLL